MLEGLAVHLVEHLTYQQEAASHPVTDIHEPNPEHLPSIQSTSSRKTTKRGRPQTSPSPPIQSNSPVTPLEDAPQPLSQKRARSETTPFSEAPPQDPLQGPPTERVMSEAGHLAPLESPLQQPSQIEQAFPMDLSTYSVPSGTSSQTSGEYERQITDMERNPQPRLDLMQFEFVDSDEIHRMMTFENEEQESPMIDPALGENTQMDYYYALLQEQMNSSQVGLTPIMSHEGDSISPSTRLSSAQHQQNVGTPVTGESQLENYPTQQQYFQTATLPPASTLIPRSQHCQHVGVPDSDGSRHMENLPAQDQYVFEPPPSEPTLMQLYLQQQYVGFPASDIYATQQQHVGSPPSESPLMENYPTQQQHYRFPPTSESSRIQTYQQNFGDLDSTWGPPTLYSPTQQEMFTELLSNLDPNISAQISYQHQQVNLEPLPRSAVEHELPHQQTVDTPLSHIRSQVLNAPSEEEQVCESPILRRTLTQNTPRQQFVQNSPYESNSRRYYTSRLQPYVPPSAPRSIPSQMSSHLQNMALLVSDPRMMNSAIQQQHIQLPRSSSMQVLDHQQETHTPPSTRSSSWPILPYQQMSERHAAEILLSMGVRPTQQQSVLMPPPRTSSKRILIHRQEILSPPSTKRSSLPILPHQHHAAPTGGSPHMQTSPTQQQDDHSSPLLRSILLSGTPRFETVDSTASDDRPSRVVIPTQLQYVHAPSARSTSTQTSSHQQYVQLRRQASAANIRVASEHRQFTESTIKVRSSPKRLPRRHQPNLSSLPFRMRDVDEDMRSIDIPTFTSSEPLVITPGDQHNVQTLPSSESTSAHQQHIAFTLHTSGNRDNPGTGSVDNTPAQTQHVTSPTSPNRRVTPPQNVSAPSSAVPAAQLTTPPSGRRSIQTEYQQQLIHGSSARIGENPSSYSATRSRRSSARTAKSLQGTPGRLVGRKLFDETDEESTPLPEDQEPQDLRQPGLSIPRENAPSAVIDQEPQDLSISRPARSSQLPGRSQPGSPSSEDPFGFGEGVPKSKGKYIIGKTIPKKGKKSSTQPTPNQPPPQPQNVSAEFTAPKAPPPSRGKKSKEKEVPKTGIDAVAPALVIQPPARIGHISLPYVHNWNILTSERVSRPVQPFQMIAGQYRRYRFGPPSPAHMINLKKMRELIDYQLNHSTDIFLRIPQTDPDRGQRVPISLVAKQGTSADDRPNTPPAVRRIRCLCDHLTSSPFTPPNRRLGFKLYRSPTGEVIHFTIDRGGNHTSKPLTYYGVDYIVPPAAVQRRTWIDCHTSRQSSRTISTARIDRDFIPKKKKNQVYYIFNLTGKNVEEEPGSPMDFFMKTNSKAFKLVKGSGQTGIPNTVGDLINTAIIQAYLSTSDNHTVGDLISTAMSQDLQGTSSNEPEAVIELEEESDSDEDSVEEEEPDFGSDYSMDEEFASALETEEEEKPATDSQPTQEPMSAIDSGSSQDSEIVVETVQEEATATVSEPIQEPLEESQHSSPQASTSEGMSTSEEMSTSSPTRTIPRSTSNTPDKKNDSNEDAEANTSTEDLNTSKKSDTSTKSDGSRKSDASKKSDASVKSNNSTILNESNKSSSPNHTGSDCAGESPSTSIEVRRRSTRKRKLEKENDDSYKCQYCSTAFKTEGTYRMHEWRCENKRGQKRRRS